MSTTKKRGEQLELGSQTLGSQTLGSQTLGSQTQGTSEDERPRDAWVAVLAKEFGIILVPLIDRSLPVERCREVATRLAELAARRVRGDDVLKVRCRGCDVEVDAREVVLLCARCGEGFRSAGSDG
jgi:hypothetical protein